MIWKPKGQDVKIKIIDAGKPFNLAILDWESRLPSFPAFISRE